MFVHCTQAKAFSTSPKCDAGSVEFGSAQSQRQEASRRTATAKPHPARCVQLQANKQRRSERCERGDSGVSGHRQGIDRADRVLLRSRGEPVFTTLEYDQSYRIFTSEGGVR